MLRSLAVAALLAAFPLQADEIAPVKSAFSDAGWKVEEKAGSFGKAMVVGEHYVFFFDRIGQRFERDLVVNPNFYRHVVLDPKFTAAVQFNGYKDLVVLPKVDVEKMPRTPLTLPHPALPRKLEQAQGQTILAGVAQQKALTQEYFDSKGARAEGVPPATFVTEAWALGDFYVLKVRNARFPAIAEQPLIVRARGESLKVLYAVQEDGAFLPLHSGFLELKALCTAAKIDPLWNSVETDAAEAGEWLRKRLSTSWVAETWKPSEIEEITAAAKANVEETNGIVFARSGDFGVALCFDEENQPMVAEFEAGALRSTMTLTDAASRVEQTEERDLWNAYEGVCRQFALPPLVFGLYRNEAMRTRS